MTNTVLVEVPEVRSKALAKCLAQLARRHDYKTGASLGNRVYYLLLAFKKSVLGNHHDPSV